MRHPIDPAGGRDGRGDDAMTTKPGYYNAGPNDLIGHWLATGRTDALMGNIQKYVERAGLKGEALPDLLKAREYLDRWIEHERRQQQQP